MKKHVLLTGAFVLVSSVLFAYKANAAIFQTNINNGEQGCIGKTLNGVCGSGQQGMDDAGAVTWQQVDFGTMSVPIDAIKIITGANGVVGAGGHGANMTAMLLDQDHWDDFVASGYLATAAWGIATSTEIAIAGTSPLATSTFPFAPAVSQTPGNEFVAVVFKITSDPGNFYKPQFAYTYQSFPPTGYGDPWLLGAGGQLPGTYAGSDLNNQRDLRIQIETTIDYPLEILVPENNSTVTANPVVISGTCENALELQVYDGVTYASSTTAFGATLTCNSNAFSYSTALDQGYWNVFASSTGETDGIVFYRLAQSQDLAAFQEFATNPFGGAEGSEYGYWTFLMDNTNVLVTKTRPYSYVPQIVLALMDGMANATSTNWIEQVAFTTTAGLIYLPGITSATFDAIPASFKNTIRPLSTIALVLSFLWLIWSFRHKII